MNIENFTQTHQNQHIAVGLSGGIDSVVLLHLLLQAQHKHCLNISAIHVHHGLSQHADEWADFCNTLCSDWKIPIEIKRVQVEPAKLGIEAAARNARYAAFEQSNADGIALAHHQDDQIETFCLAALRGSGIRGLAAMSAHQILDNINIFRPLLHYSRQQIEQYAQQHQLPYITDDSNHNPAFLRNWLRHQGLPYLRQRLAHANQHILAAITNLQDELTLINEIIESDKQYIYQNQKFDLTLWRQLSPVRRRQQLILLTKQHNLGTARRASVVDFERVLINNPNSAKWVLPKGIVLAYANTLFALPNHWHKQFTWQTPISGNLKEITTKCPITFKQVKTGLPEHIFSQNITIRTAQPNDVLPMKTGNKSIKKLLQEHHIPPFLRQYYPIIIDKNGVCLAVVGLAVNQRVAVTNGILPVCEILSQFML